MWLTGASSNQVSAITSGFPPCSTPLLYVGLCCSPAPLACLQSLRGAEELLDKLPAMDGDNRIKPVWLGEIFQGECKVLNAGGRRDRGGRCVKSLSGTDSGQEGEFTPLLTRC